MKSRSSFLLIFIILGMISCNQSGSNSVNDNQESQLSAAEPDLTLELRQSEEYGNYLTDNQGRSLYIFKADSVLHSNCHGDCADAWPPLTVEQGVLPQGGIGINTSLISTFERRDGELQVAYNGWPLYYFEKDGEPGQTKGHDVTGHGEEWYLIGAEGEEIKSGTPQAQNSI